MYTILHLSRKKHGTSGGAILTITSFRRISSITYFSDSYELSDEII